MFVSPSNLKRRGVTKVQASIILVVVGLVVALVVPFVQKTREAAARTQSINNLKQLGLGAQSFHDANRRLPFNGSDSTVNDVKYRAEAELYNTSFTGSWAFQVLPYTDSFMTMWPKIREFNLRSYQCLGRGRPFQEQGKGAWSDYFINNYLNDPEKADTPDNADHRTSLDDITDGLANTIFAGHGNISTSDYSKNENVVGSSNIFLGGTFGTARGGPNWQDGQKVSVELRRDSAEPPDFAAGGWGGPFPQGGLFVFCDGTVRMIPYNMSGHLFGALLTPTGNERVELPD